MKRILNLLTLVGMIIFLTACDNENKINTKAYKETEFLMGTYVSLSVYDADKEAVIEEGFALVRDLADKITGETTESEISKINAAAGEKPVVVSEEVYELIEAAAKYSVEMDGQFNYTIGPITNLWRIGFDDARKPSQEEITEALKKIDFNKVTLNAEEHSVFLQEAGMEIDLGAIAKGYITDQVRELFVESDVTTAIIDLGGNVFVMGASPAREGDVWNVGIQDPFAERGASIGSTQQSERSIVTSGIYERYLEVDGEIYHHLMNPKTGYPFDNEIAGVSIISETSVDGDALSTLVFGLGVEEGLAYVNGRSDVEAVFVTKDKEVYLSEGLKDNFELRDEDYTIVEK
ncbi:MAG: FAD:protein FMN transferase [Lactobacillales bacterium]|nr:FAD:protein FMN transferase [Lactobacillales bacterium]